MAKIGMTKQEGIETVFSGGGHVVILGAGASIASTYRNPEKNGKRLPSMNNFIELLGLQDIVEKIPIGLRADNFETLYTNLHNQNPNSDEIKEIEKRIWTYFGDMELPDIPTIYDYLVMSLRGKDLIATFNWDPFLFQAWSRNYHIGESPRLAFLHGNVIIGLCKEEGLRGHAGMYTSNGKLFEPSRLLFPIAQKNYSNDEFIVMEWNTIKQYLSKDNGTVRVTIFGYGAPSSDVEAVKLLNDAWGTSDERNMEQFEVIDILPDEELRGKWDGFINSHHYNTADDYFNSVLAINPRRTSESYFHHYQPMSPQEAFREPNPIPNNFATLHDFWQWHLPLVKAEEIHNQNRK